MKHKIYWFFVPIFLGLISCSANFSIVGRKNLWIGFSRSIEMSKHYGVFMWEYGLDKDSITLYGRKYPLPINEVFAEPSYHFRDYKTDSLQILGTYHVVINFNDTLPRIDSLEKTSIQGHIIMPLNKSSGLEYLPMCTNEEKVLPPDTMQFYILLSHNYRDSTGSQFNSRGYLYRDSLGNSISHIDTLDSFKIIRKREY